MKKLGRYDLVRVIGKGAMGMVYEARDPNLDRKVAIKTIKVENLSEEEASEYELRFRTEARSAARLQHPNIVSVYDSDRDVDVAYLVIEFIQGEDLKHHLDRGDVYTLGQTVAIIGDLLSALDYAHRNGIVHRDIKPANLLLEPGGRVKLADFGVARIQDSADATRTQGSMVGTLKYMSPEQVQSQPVDARADLFAAGIVLYQLLTGVRPFDGSSDFEIIQKITSAQPQPPSSLTPGLPTALDAVLARALEKSREDRYPTAQAFKDALLAAVQGGDTDQTLAPRPKAPAKRPALASEPTGGGSASGVTSTVTQELELVYWKDITESDDPADFYGFLNRFPGGIYADLARRKLKRLNPSDGSGSVPGSSVSLVFQPSQGADDTTHVSVRAAALLAGHSLHGAPPAALASADAPPLAIAPAAAGTPQPGRRWQGVGAMVAVLVLAPLAYWLWPASPAQDGRVVAAAAVAAQPASAPAAALAPAPMPTSVPEPKPAVPESGAPVLAALPHAIPDVAHTGVAAPAPAVASIAKPADRAATSAALSASSAHSAVVPKPAALVRQTQEQAKLAEPVAAGNDPRAACKDRWLLSYQICMTRKCAEAAFAQHPVCAQRHDMEQHNKSRDQTPF